MTTNHTLFFNASLVDFFLLLIFILLIVVYIVAMRLSNKRFSHWPRYRIATWIMGIMAIAVSVVGPFAHLAHINFIAHMVGHLLLGMLAPLLIALSAPMTLILRTLSIRTARRLTRVLRSKLVRFYMNPIVASILNIGGLWILYTTDLYTAMHQNIALHIFIHIHIFIAGYLFTISLIYVDPIPHRYSYLFRTVVFIFALAGHGILSKYIYATPPTGVPIDEAEIGGMLMYYGGDVIDLFIIILLFYQWYKDTRLKRFQINYPVVEIR